jgi:hypothetical protein
MRIIALAGFVHGVAGSSASDRCSQAIAEFKSALGENYAGTMNDFFDLFESEITDGRMNEAESKFCVLSMMIGAKALDDQGGHFARAVNRLQGLILKADDAREEDELMNYAEILSEALGELRRENLLSEQEINRIQGNEAETGIISPHTVDQGVEVYNNLQTEDDCISLLWLFDYTKTVWNPSQFNAPNKAYQYFNYNVKKPWTNRWCVVAMRAGMAALIAPEQFYAPFEELEQYMYPPMTEGEVSEQEFFEDNNRYQSFARMVWDQFEKVFPSIGTSSGGVTNCEQNLKRLLSTPFWHYAGLRVNQIYSSQLIQHLVNVVYIMLELQKKQSACPGGEDCDTCKPSWCAPLAKITEQYLKTATSLEDEYRAGWGIYCLLGQAEVFLAPETTEGRVEEDVKSRCKTTTLPLFLEKKDCTEALKSFGENVNRVAIH